MNIAWINFSLLAAVFYAARYVTIKKYLASSDTLFIAFASRAVGALCLLPVLCRPAPAGLDSWLFFRVIAATSVLTAAASVMQIHAVRKYEISSSLPFLSFVPLFMVACVYLVFGELPGQAALYGVVLLCAGGAAVNYGGDASFSGLFSSFAGNRGSIMFFSAAVILGFTTTLDRLAIDDARGGGLYYSACWNAFSALLFAIIFLDARKAPEYLVMIKRDVRPLVAQGIIGIAAFACQMMAVEYARSVSANVVYVKSLTLLQTVFAVAAGVTLFGERNASRKLLASALMAGGAVMITVFYR